MAAIKEFLLSGAQIYINGEGYKIWHNYIFIQEQRNWTIVR